MTDALDSLLRPVAALLNRQLKAKTPARELCAELDGRVCAVRVSNTGLATYLVVTADEVHLTTEFDGDPDVIIAGSLLSLARLAGPDPEAAFRDGSIDLTGDAIVAQQFQALLRYGRPDFEEELSGVVGDSVAHGMGEIARNVSRWGQEVGATLRQNVSEYLQEESRAAPSRYEVDEFREQVNVLRDDVARLEARMARVEEQHGT